MKPEEFARRRQEFLGFLGDGNIAVIANSSKKHRNRDVHFPFRSDSDFYYLTGLAQEDTIAVFIPGRKRGEYILFCYEKDPKKELWDGEMVGVDEAINLYGADDAFPLDDIDDILPGMLENRHKLVYNMGSNPYLDHHLVQWINRIKEFSRTGVHAPEEIASHDAILHEMRLKKSREEIKKMRMAANITARAHERAMRYCKPGMYEFQLEAEILYEVRRSGAQSVAYSSIVASGPNACVLHYINNARKIRRHDLVLIDAGAEYDHYAADVTRTFPASGKFTAAQKSLYQVVLDAQLAAIAKAMPGTHWNESHEAAVQVVAYGLKHLGLVKGSMQEIIEKNKYRKYFMHRAGHWLGMDVHDVGEYKISGKWRILEPGMMLTIEPGIYVPPDDETVAKRWRGIGIRIEDDVLVTRKEPEVLTQGIVKEVSDVEALVGSI
jgi:Xaa-Pro aminopeptidase